MGAAQFTFIDAQRKTDLVSYVTSVILRMRFLFLCCFPLCDDTRCFLLKCHVFMAISFGWMSLQNLSCASGRESYFGCKFPHLNLRKKTSL